MLDPGADIVAMVIVYRGLGPEMGKAYAYDTADWIIEQVKKAIPKESLDKIIFAVPDDYNQDCETCLHQAKQLIDKRNGKISSYSLCGFSKGGSPVYQNLSRKPWKILGLIDAVSPSMVKGFSNTDVDKYAPRIRCIYGVSHWGTRPPPGTSPKHYTKSQRGYMTIKDFYDHLKALDVDMIDATDNQGHADMPAVFFKKYGSSFL